jgi:hypothetical protein
MDPSETTQDPLKDPYLPPLKKFGDFMAPMAPQKKADAESEFKDLCDLAMKLADTVARFTTDWAAQQMHLSMSMARDVLTSLSQEGLIEELWQTGTGSAHYRITEQGHTHALRLVEACAYIGPAPVTMEAYSAMLRWQFATSPPVKPEHVAQALSQMVLPKKSAQLAGLAVSSGRSLFVYGPSGNGKSSIGRNIHSALQGDYWIPYAISVQGVSVIRVFDAQCHEKINLGEKATDVVDNRWARIKRPMVVVGGELTLDMLDLIFSPAFRYYEAPPHLKSNGGVFLVDDFGRERVSPEQLLNRFITPMEHSFDYFTLRTGQKIQLPLRHVLIIATNLGPERVTDPAFLRRMGYRLYLGSPSEAQYSKIFKAYAARNGVEADQEIIDMLLNRYRQQNRELRACEPRDLIERCKDICKFHNRPLEISPKVLDIAWTGYFGENLKPIREEQAPMKEDSESTAETAA